MSILFQGKKASIHLESVPFFIPTQGEVLILQGSPMIHCLGDTVLIATCIPVMLGWC